ncbi:MAG: hypothetical protein JF617_14225 [Burkholderiales bacterium]|nr:hypothetical protein [Burkholderiales bacterium]
MIRFQPSGAAVLLCTAEAASAIRQLRSALAAALRNVGVTSKASSTPHLTIFYDKLHPIAETALETPLTWQAADFSLVVSHKGLGHHEVVRTWALRK